MICKLCEINEANKKNTHYLTDSIIRSCLNADGVNQREKGFMFDVSSNKPFIEFNFQRETPQSSIENALGRQPSEAEIANAKQNAYSVDYFFCTACEDMFTNIENNFANTILPKLRGQDLTGIEEINFSEKIIIRLFFYIQVWRTSVCDETFNIPRVLQNKLRSIIFNKNISEEEIISIPINITYLNTLGDDFEYTKNLVGIGLIEGNYIIFLNDFIIQIFKNEEEIKWIDLFGVNDKETFRYYANYNEKDFVIKVINNEERVEVSNRYYRQDKVDEHISYYKNAIEKLYVNFLGYPPTPEVISKFINGIIYGNDCTPETRYSQQRFIKYTYEFVKENP